MPSDTGSKEINELLHHLHDVLTRQSKLSRERANLSWFAEVETEGLDAYIYPDEDDARHHHIAGYDHFGRRVVGKAKYADPQSEAFRHSTATDSLVNSPQAVSSHTSLPQDIACNASESTQDRLAALLEWVVADNDSAACFILSELAKDQPNDEWLTSIVFAAEDVRFPGREQQQQAASRLRAIALELRERSDVKSEQAVFSAVRRFASLVPEEDADELLDFLTHTGNIDTRLVALQCVAYIFEAEPPRKAVSVESLRNRLFDLTNKFLDADVLVPGETSAIAEQVINGLAATGDNRLESCIARVKCIGISWFSNIVYRNLISLRDSWLSENAGVQDHPAFEQVSRILEDWE